jgi:hypothetical protein
MNNALTTLDPETFEVMRSMAKAMSSSMYFEDAKDAAKALVKIQAGAELGLPPFASMTGIHIIKGKPVLGANLVGTLIKNDPRYDYRIIRLDNDGCIIAFFEHDEKVGESSFTVADAKDAGLTSGNWQKFRRNMFFARAISNGAKWYTPGIFGGSPVYTPDEFGIEVNEDGYIDGEVIEEPQPPQPSNNARPPAPPEHDGVILDPFMGAVKVANDTLFPDGDTAPKSVSVPMPTAAQKKRYHATGKKLHGDAWDDIRPKQVEAITKRRDSGEVVTSSNDLTRAEMQYLIDGMADKLEEAGK